MVIDRESAIMPSGKQLKNKAKSKRGSGAHGRLIP
jgi:hypothetical protein